MENNHKEYKNFLGEMPLRTIQSLPIAEVGDLAYSTDTEEFLVYNGEEWTSLIIPEVEEETLPTMDLYNFNKMIMEKMPELSNENLLEKMKLFNLFGNEKKNEYYMLYGKEISYFTLFRKDSKENDSIEKGMLDCLNSIGKVLSIERVEDESAIEIWVKVEEDVTVLYFFPYDMGVYPVRF